MVGEANIFMKVVLYEKHYLNFQDIRCRYFSYMLETGR